MIKFTVPGMPRGKGRPRFTRDGHAYTDGQTRDYETLVRQCYQQAAGTYDFPGAVCLSVRIVLPVPGSDSRRVRTDKLIGCIPPTRKPDVDNVAKIVMDALNGAAWADDKQVTQLSVAKFYGSEARVEVCVTAAGGET